MRSCGTFDTNFASLQLADDLLVTARDHLSAEEFALLVAGSAGRWRFSAVWKTLRHHIIKIIDEIWLDKVQPNLNNILMNNYSASIESALTATGVSERELLFLVKCVMLGKPSMQVPLEVYIDEGGY